MLRVCYEDLLLSARFGMLKLAYIYTYVACGFTKKILELSALLQIFAPVSERISVPLYILCFRLRDWIICCDFVCVELDRAVSLVFIYT